MKRKFLREGSSKHKKLGKGRKKKQKWRKPKGKHNKIREKRKGRIKKVEVGYKREKRERGKIKGKAPVLVKNQKEAEKIARGSIIIIGKIGRKKRKELEKKIKEKGGEILNKTRRK
jgi:large subunit ribosomal protein L32e